MEKTGFSRGLQGGYPAGRPQPVDSKPRGQGLTTAPAREPRSRRWRPGDQHHLLGLYPQKSWPLPVTAKATRCWASATGQRTLTPGHPTCSSQPPMTPRPLAGKTARQGAGAACSRAVVDRHSPWSARTSRALGCRARERRPWVQPLRTAGAVQAAPPRGPSSPKSPDSSSPCWEEEKDVGTWTGSSEAAA